MILRMLDDPALLKLAMVPELVRLTIPAALLVMPAILPEPPRFKVPLLVKLASTVLMTPVPVMVVVPELANVVNELVPPIVSVPVFVKVPEPDNAVPTVSVPAFV